MGYFDQRKRGIKWEKAKHQQDVGYSKLPFPSLIGPLYLAITTVILDKHLI